MKNILIVDSDPAVEESLARYCALIGIGTTTEPDGIRARQIIGRRSDLTLIIDLDPTEAINRVSKRNDGDMFDNVEKLKRCRDGYKWYFENSENKCAWVNGNGTKEEVFERVKLEIEKIL
jgi:thymidylate kinase